MNIGYARVSTQDQNLALQLDALKKAKCELIFEEKISGKKRERPELDKTLEKLRKGDCLIVWKLDRLGRSLKDLIEIITNLNGKGIKFRSIQDNIDTNTPTGRFTFNIFASLAEFEREIIRERTMAGLQAARARGRAGGRPKGLTKEAISKMKAVVALYNNKQKTMQEIAQDLGISRATCYRYLELNNNQQR